MTHMSQVLNCHRLKSLRSKLHILIHNWCNIFIIAKESIVLFSYSVFRKKKVFRIFKEPFQASKDAGRPSFREKVTDSQAFIFDFLCLFWRYIDLCVSLKAFFGGRRSSAYFETLFKQIKMPEDLRFRKKSSTREHSSWIFVVFLDVILICAFQLKHFSIEEDLDYYSVYEISLIYAELSQFQIRRRSIAISE